MAFEILVREYLDAGDQTLITFIEFLEHILLLPKLGVDLSDLNHALCCTDPTAPRHLLVEDIYIYT